MVAALERERDVVEENAAGDLDPLVLEDEHVAAAPLRRGEVEAEPARPAVRSAASEAAASFSLARRPIWVSFAWACFALFFLYRKRATKRSRRSMSPATRSAVFCACAARCAFSSRQTCHGPGEVGGAAGLELERGVGHRFEEPAVVRDDHAGGVERGELALEPLEAGDVQVVGGLVEEDEVGIAGQGARERRAGDLTAREGRELAVEVVVVEAEAANDCAGVVAPPVPARVLEAGLGARVGRERRLVVVACGHRLLEPRSSRSVATRSEAPERTYSRRLRLRSSGGRWSWSAMRVPFSITRSPPSIEVSPISMRISVVLPAPFGPASASRSRRSSLNETPSKSRLPANSLRRLEAITTAMSPWSHGRA